MKPWLHLTIGGAWLVFGIVAYLLGWASKLELTFALSIAALVETRIGAWEASRAASNTEGDT